MKKIVITIPIVALVAIILLFRFGGGFGVGHGNGKDDRSVVSEDQENESELNEKDQSITNNEESNENVIKVTVVGNDYFYENEKIELDVLVKKLKEIEGSYVVQVKNEQASKNAYEALINAFNDNGIVYTD